MMGAQARHRAARGNHARQNIHDPERGNMRVLKIRFMRQPQGVALIRLENFLLQHGLTLERERDVPPACNTILT